MKTTVGFILSLVFVGLAMIYEHVYHDYSRAALSMAWAIWIYATSRPEAK